MNKTHTPARNRNLFRALAVFSVLTYLSLAGGTLAYVTHLLSETTAEQAVSQVHEARKASAQAEHEWKQDRFEEKLAAVEAKHLARLCR